MKTFRLTSALAAVALGAVAATHAATHSAFTPKVIAGTWTGKWTNKTSGNTGPAKIVAKSLAGDAKLQFVSDFGGTIFGCNNPSPEKSKVLTKGSGYGHWSASGFKLKAVSNALGTVTLVYSHSAKTIKASGKNTPCLQGLTWTENGKFSGKKFSGTVKITFNDGSHNTAVLALTRK
jgi:hypothetical protein